MIKFCQFCEVAAEFFATVRIVQYTSNTPDWSNAQICSYCYSCLHGTRSIDELSHSAYFRFRGDTSLFNPFIEIELIYE